MLQASILHQPVLPCTEATIASNYQNSLVAIATMHQQNHTQFDYLAHFLYLQSTTLHIAALTRCTQLAGKFTVTWGVVNYLSLFKYMAHF